MRKSLHLKGSIVQILLLLLVIQASCSILPETSVEALVEGSAKMPCNVQPKRDDHIEFIFWYKNDGVTALYTLDARDKPLRDAVHMRNETYSDRVQFHVGDPPYLQMDDLRDDDTGAYFCRVDYQWSATEIKRVNLVVVVPPKKLVIRDDSGKDVADIAGPYKEKTDISLFCEAQKGYPSPNVTWWKDNRLWDTTFTKVSTGVVNEMRLSNLSRADLLTTFHCKAQNTRLAPPITRTVVLDLHLYPVSVRISTRVGALSAGRPVELRCESHGSRPPAALTWWLNGTQLSEQSGSPELDGGGSTSLLRLTPKRRHHRAPLACRAENPRLRDSRMQDQRTLNITYVPQVSLRLIKEEADRQPKEDDFVRLVCDVDANPSVLKVGWLFGDTPLAHNESLTDLASGSTLVFKRLARRNRGRYRCYAINEEGRGVSDDLTLNISHAPVCKANQQITYVVALNESAVVRCEVEAEPQDVTFKWEFSNTVRKHYNLQHASRGTVSNATYTPASPADYGTLFCWANNSIGHQQSSCFFTVIAPACKAEKTKTNASTSSREGSGDSLWPHSAITAGAGAVASVLIVITVCVFYFRKIYLQKKHRPSGVGDRTSHPHFPIALCSMDIVTSATPTDIYVRNQSVAEFPLGL